MKRLLILGAVVFFLAGPAHAARARRGDSRTSAPITLKGVGKQTPTPIVTTLAPVVKGQPPAATPVATPAPEAIPERRPTRSEPRPAVKTAQPAPPPAAAPGVDKALADLLAQPATAATRDKLRAYVAAHTKPEQIVPAMIRIGAIGMTLGDWTGAANTYEAAVKTATQPAEKALAREGLVEALLHQNRLGDAAAAWQSLTAEAPAHVPSPATQIDAGMMLAMLGKTADARRMWDQLDRTLQTLADTQAAPLRTKLSLARALADELEGRVDQARAQYQDLAQRQGRSPSGLLARARIDDINRPLISTLTPTAAKP